MISIVNDSRPVIRNNLFEVSGNHSYAGAIAWTVPSGRPGPTIVGNTFVMLPGATGALVTAGGFDSAMTFANNVLVGPAGANLMDCPPGNDGLPPNLRANDAWTPSGPGLTGLCAGAVGTAGHISVDPVFVSAATGDYHLRADSPLIDAGDNGVAMVPDVDGDVRPFDGNEDGTATADIGFDESVDPLAVVPGDIGFGSVPLARASNATVTLRNLGSTSLQVAAVEVSGPSAGDYATAGDSCSGATLAVGGSCSTPVAFTPTELGQRAATLTIDVAGSPEPRRVALSGAGVDPIELSPTQFRFDDVTVGDPGAPGIITVTNRGGTAVTIGAITVTGNASDVTLAAETCTGGPLPQDGTCSIAFTWRPRDSGDRAADIVISGPLPLGTRSIPVTGHAWPAPSGVAWGTSYAAGPAYAWNGGTALGRTVQSGRQRLHLVYATDRVGGRWATDSGPKVGVYYIRSSTGSTWTTPFRLNPTTQHATSMGLAAAGAKVYAVWASQTRYVSFSPTAPRVLYVRVNTNHGSSSAWRSRIALSPSTGRVDYPVIAAYGTDAHIAYTNATTGTVSVRSSRDGGLHWVRTGLGSTSIAFRTGRTGFPTIAASGKTVAACWLSDVAGTIRCRVSTNRGVTWGAATIVGSESTGYFSVAVRGSRIAVAWTTPSDVVIRQRLSGVWQPAQTVPTPYRAELSGVTVALQDPQRIRLTWSDGEQDGDFTYVFSSESVDGGTMWFQFEHVGAPGQARWQNKWPSMIWPSPGTRYAVWNGWTANTNTYRLYLRRGLGTPVGPWQSAALWTPGKATSAVRADDTPKPAVRTPDVSRGGASSSSSSGVR
jgi:hypothetical protein